MSETMQKTAEMLAQERTELAIERTAMAADRTLMAWTRTSLSMISFGFTVFKFVEYMHQEGKKTLIKSEQGAQNFGLFLIALGIISLTIACVQFWQFEKKSNSARKWYLNLAFVTAGFIALLGILSLMNAIFKIGPF